MEYPNCTALYQYSVQTPDFSNIGQPVKLFGSPLPQDMTVYPANVCTQQFYHPDATPWLPQEQVHPNDVMTHAQHYSDMRHAGAHPASSMSAHAYAIARRNERERNRVRNINSTFERLRKHLPATSGRKRKLSKFDTLRTAIRYIEHLQNVLDETSDGDVMKTGKEPETVTKLKTDVTDKNSTSSTCSVSPFSLDTSASDVTRPDVTTIDESIFMRSDFTSCKNLARIS